MIIWNDTNLLPEDGVPVLAIMKDDNMAVLRHNVNGYWQWEINSLTGTVDEDSVVGWREIEQD